MVEKITRLQSYKTKIKKKEQKATTTYRRCLHTPTG